MDLRHPKNHEEAANLAALAERYTIYGLAKRTGISRSTLQSRLRAARAMLGPDFVPGEPTYDPIAEPAPKPRVRVKAGSSRYEYAGRPFTAVVFGDAHNQPGMSTDRFQWLGRLVNEVRPDALVDIGDFDDLRSLCAHEHNDTWKGRFKPAFQEDLIASEAAHRLLHETITHDCERHKVLGNHEDRIAVFENANPETHGTYSAAYADILNRYRWHVTPYRGWLDLHGIDVTHIPMSGINKPASGARPAVTLSNKLTRDCIFGHTHLYNFHNEQKFGPAPGRSISVLNTGTFAPTDYVAEYARGALKQSWYGCFIVEIEKGRIASHEPITMRQLQRRYS